MSDYPSKSMVASALYFNRRSKNLSVAELAERSGVSEATIRRIERSTRGEEVQPTAATMRRLEHALGEPEGWLFRASMDDESSRVVRRLREPRELYHVLHEVWDDLAKSRDDTQVPWFVADAVDHVVEPISELIVTMQLEAMHSGARWMPWSQEREELILSALTASEPEQGTPQHCRWAYRRWLVGRYDGEQYIESFEKRLRAVRSYEEGEAVEQPRDSGADPKPHTVELLRRAAEELGMTHRAGVSMETLLALAGREKSCGKIHGALEAILFGRPLDDPTPLQLALLNDQKDFDGLTDRQRELLRIWGLEE